MKMTFNINSQLTRLLRDATNPSFRPRAAIAMGWVEPKQPADRLLHDCALELRGRVLLQVCRGGHPGFELLLEWLEPSQLALHDTSSAPGRAGLGGAPIRRASNAIGGAVVAGAAGYPIGAWSRLARELRRVLVPGGLVLVFEEWKLEPRALSALITRGDGAATERRPSSPRWTRRLAALECARLDVCGDGCTAATGRFLLARKPESSEL